MLLKCTLNSFAKYYSKVLHFIHVKVGFHVMSTIATIATKKAERSLRLWSLSSFHMPDCCDRYDR